MKGSLIAAIVAILTDQGVVPGLPETDELTRAENGGDEVKKASPKLRLKVLRLQNLYFQLNEKMQPRDFSGVQHLSQNTGLNHMRIMMDAMKVTDEIQRQLLMITSIATEVVRAEIPAECERFNVIYVVNRQNQLVRHRIIKQQTSPATE